MYRNSSYNKKQGKVQQSYVDILISTTAIDMIEPNRATEDKTTTKNNKNVTPNIK